MRLSRARRTVVFAGSGGRPRRPGSCPGLVPGPLVSPVGVLVAAVAIPWVYPIAPGPVPLGVT